MLTSDKHKRSIVSHMQTIKQSNNDSLIDKQKEIEHKSITTGRHMYLSKVQEIHSSASKDNMVLKPEVDLLKRDAAKLAIRINRFANDTSKANPTTYKLRPILKQMDSFELAYMTMRQCYCQIGVKKLVSVQDQGVKLGKMVATHMNYLKFVKAMPGYAHVIEQKLSAATQIHKHRVLNRAINNKAKTIGIVKWNADLHRAVGLKLLIFFVEECKTFYLINMPTGKGVKKVPMKRLQITDTAFTWLDKYHDRCSWLQPFKLPMIVKPVEWSDPYDGGYLLNSQVQASLLLKNDLDQNRPTQILKMKIDKRCTEINKRLKSENPTALYKGINLIQSTPWQINKATWEVMNVLKDSALAGIPHRDFRLELPPKPWANDKEHTYMKKHHPERVLAWNKKASAIHDIYHRSLAKRRAFTEQLRIAKNYTDYQEIFFPLTCDWRTRNYPEPWFIHPQSDDLGRGLLEFANGKRVELGSRPAAWLMIHAANCYGEDKISYLDRVEWIMTNKDNIQHSAQKPYDNLWWTEADKPWQFLAACFELDQLWSTGMVDTHVPVQMDGTCNGLQNFSMLMHDEYGGAAVNLVNHDKPADIYTQVMIKTLELVERDSRDVTLEDLTRQYARAWLQAGIDRKIVKRNVMTLPYGASLFGFADQLVDEVRKRGTLGNPYLPDDIMFNCCRYLARINRQAISMVVVKSVECMDWMQEITTKVAKAGHTIAWTTPLGVTVEQKSMKQKLKRIETYWGGVRIRLGINQDTDKLHTNKMSNGIAPNYIHSMDASHLILTTLCMSAKGVKNFSMIHDSYGTLATDVDTMQSCIRETFYKMYTDENLLEKFFNDVTKDLPEDLVAELPPMPAMGNLDMESVLGADYFFA